MPLEAVFVLPGFCVNSRVFPTPPMSLCVQSNGANDPGLRLIPQAKSILLSWFILVILSPWKLMDAQRLQSLFFFLY